jgi:subtilisin family serine protease
MRRQAIAPAQGYEPALEPLFPLQWGLRMINADDAIRAGFTGKGALIGIIDTGIYYDHPDLAPNYVGGRNFFAPYCAEDPASLPSTCDPNDPIDDNGHGSHVAGIVAAAANQIGVIGVAPDAKLIAAKVCGRTVGCPIGAMIAGMLYAADQGVDAMNISIGGFGDQRGGDAEWVALKRAANYVHARGSLVVNSAGNNGIDLNEIPGFIKRLFEQGNMLVVSAVGPDAEAASIFGEVYTNTGGQVDVAAPGGSYPPLEALVVSAWSPLSPDLPGALWAFAAGTSMAAPHATGTAAQIVGAYGHLPPSRISAIIRNTATDLGKPGHDPLYGQGVVNVAADVGLDDQPD